MTRGFFRREAVAHNVLGHDPRNEELQQVIAPARFRPAPAHLETAKGMPPDDRPGAGTIDVDVAGFQLGFRPLDVGRAAREKARGQRIIGAVRDLDRFVQIAHFDHAQDRAENFLARDPGGRFYIGENSRRDKVTVVRHILRLIGQRRLFFADFDHLEDPFVGSLVDHRTDRDTRFLGIPDPQTRRRGEKTLHHPIVVFLKHDEPGERGTFLALVTKGGINRVDDRLVEVGVGIDDDGVLAAHLADDALQFALAGERLAG